MEHNFQKAVWQELSSIPYRKLRSYGEIVKSIGSPKASRAVGAANGDLTGYAHEITAFECDQTTIKTLLYSTCFAK